MAFVKLDCDIVRSSVWAEDSDTVRVWVYLLATARATGEVRVTVPALAMQCGLPAERAQAILDKFASPDPFSRSQEYEGRRIRIERDPEFKIVVLNYGRYRAKDHTNAERQKRFRGKHKRRRASVTPLRNARITARNTSQKSEVLLEEKGVSAADAAPLSRGASRRIEYPEWFTSWWELYRQHTGRGTKKRDTYQAARRLGTEEQGALVAVTEAWFGQRDTLKRSGVFVPEAPDPVRFIRHRRWEDEFELPVVADHKAPVSAEDLEAFRRARDDTDLAGKRRP